MSAQPLQLLLLFFAGWANCQQADVIDYLKEENRAFREKLGDKPVRLSKDQRRRLAVKGIKEKRTLFISCTSKFHQPACTRRVPWAKPEFGQPVAQSGG